MGSGNLRHLGMIRSSPSWRRHFFLQSQDTPKTGAALWLHVLAVFVEEFKRQMQAKTA